MHPLNKESIDSTLWLLNDDKLIDSNLEQFSNVWDILLILGDLIDKSILNKFLWFWKSSLKLDNAELIFISTFK